MLLGGEVIHQDGGLVLWVVGFCPLTDDLANSPRDINIRVQGWLRRGFDDFSADGVMIMVIMSKMMVMVIILCLSSIIIIIIDVILIVVNIILVVACVTCIIFHNHIRMLPDETNGGS